MQAACNGLTSCNYTVRVETLGDCAVYQAKDFRVTYSCGSTNKRASAPAEAGFGSVVTLTCP